MNQDFTVKKKSNICLKKKISAEGFTRKKKFLHKAVGEKKNSCKLKISDPPPPPTPHHFSNGPSLSCDVMAMKILSVIGAFRSVHCHSQTVFNGWSICRFASHSLGVSFCSSPSISRLFGAGNC